MRAKCRARDALAEELRVLMQIVDALQESWRLSAEPSASEALPAEASAAAESFSVFSLEETQREVCRVQCDLQALQT